MVFTDILICRHKINSTKEKPPQKEGGFILVVTATWAVTAALTAVHDTSLEVPVVVSDCLVLAHHIARTRTREEVVVLVRVRR